MQESLVRFLGREVSWRRDRLPTPVFLGFPGASDGKESACNEGDWIFLFQRLWFLWVLLYDSAAKKRVNLFSIAVIATLCPVLLL